MDSLTRKILENLSERSPITATALAQKVNKDEKTVRTRLKQIEDELRDNGGEVTSKRGVGYLLVLHDREKYAAWLADRQEDKGIPANSEERVAYLLADLLSQNSFVRLDDLCQTLYISRNTLTADLKQVEAVFQMYHLEIERRPNYGIRVNGREFDRRLCMANCLIKRSQFHGNHFGQTQELTTLATIIRNASHRYRLTLTETTFDGMIVHTYVANLRIRQGCGFVSTPEYKEAVKKKLNPKVLEAAQWIAGEIESQLGIRYDENEVLYLALHFGGKAGSNSPGVSGNNFVISTASDEKVSRMLQAVFDEYKLDFRGNLDLRMSLNQHIVPMDVRMHYSIPLKNPILDEVKKEYPFAYTLAATACSALNGDYQRQIPEDEVGYIAILFSLALEKGKKEITKKNIVVMVSASPSASRLFIYRYRQIFGKYINEIYECAYYELETFPYEEKQIDYVFTSAPINIHVPVPIFELSPSFDPNEVASFRQMFEKSSQPDLTSYFSPNLFLPDLAASSKEDALRKLCALIKEHQEVPEDFYEAVWKRESAGHTDFGNLVALPHPNHPITRDTFVTVAVLQKPILWTYNQVQVIFLMSVSRTEGTDASHLIDAVSKFMFSEESVQRLVASPSYETLEQLLIENINRK